MYLVLIFFLILLFRGFWLHFFQFVYWVRRDAAQVARNRKSGNIVFEPYGVKMFCGRQGSGKTVGMTWYMEQLRKQYPKAKIYTNFGYAHQDAALQSLNDLLIYRNGTDGIIFALDEIQNEFSSAVSKDFPETLLSTLTMQRKQRITILTTSQVFRRVAKPLREQCYEVIECRTLGGRWTFLASYDADEYNRYIDSVNPDNKAKIPRRWRKSFVQTDALRALYDTFEVVDRLSRDGFATRA